MVVESDAPRAQRAAAHAGADALRRGQPLLPVVREERRLHAAGGRLRPRRDVGRTSTTCSPTAPRRRLAPGHAARLQPLHPVRAVRAGSSARSTASTSSRCRAAASTSTSSSTPSRAGSRDTDIAADDKAVRRLPGGRHPAQARAASPCPSASARYDGARSATSGARATRRTRRADSPMNAMSVAETAKSKLTVATTSLAGCFGCHMSLLDIDERLFDCSSTSSSTARRSPTSSTAARATSASSRAASATPRTCTCCGSSAASARCCVAVGACAVNGGLPAQRNHLDVRECLQRCTSPARARERLHPQRSRAAAAARQGAPAARRGEGRLLPARAARRRPTPSGSSSPTSSPAARRSLATGSSTTTERAP